MSTSVHSEQSASEQRLSYMTNVITSKLKAKCADKMTRTARMAKSSSPFIYMTASLDTDESTL